jgi:hypothetical protein
LSLNVTAAAAAAGDTLEVRVASASTNKIAGGSLSAQTPLLGSVACPAVTGRLSITLDTALLPRSSAVILVVHSQNERLNTSATGFQHVTVNTMAAAAASRPQLLVPSSGPWSFVGVSAIGTPVTATPIILTEPAGVADGDLLIACIASRTTATTAITGTGWTAVGSQNNNNTLTTGSAIASGTMLYRIRSGTPTLSFTLPATVSVAMGQIVAYRGNAATTPLDASTAVTAAAGLTPSVTGLTTTQDDDLIVAMAAGGQEAAWSAFTNVTTPLTASGATDTTTAPSTTAWIERADNVTTSGADTSLGIFDVVRTATGATGNLSVTASVSAGHVVIAGAFKIAAGGTNVSATVTGQAIAASVGTVTVSTVSVVNVSANVTGQEVTAAVGSVTVTGKASASVTGQALTTAVGTATVVGKATANATGQAATVSVGTVTATGKATASVTGLQATAAVGSASVVGKATATLTGQEIACTVGSVVLTAIQRATATVAGQSAAVSVGTVTVSTAAALAGVGVWNGTSWVQKPAKVWTGSAWVQKPVKTWNGTSWAA